MKKFLYKYADGIVLNANDIFGPAADDVMIDLYDVPELLKIEAKYGFDGVKAFMSKVNGCEPLRSSETYVAAKKELEDYKLDEDSVTQADVKDKLIEMRKFLDETD